MCVKLSPENLKSDFCSPHLIITYIYRVTITPKVCDNTKNYLYIKLFFIKINGRTNLRQQYSKLNREYLEFTSRTNEFSLESNEVTV